MNMQKTTIRRETIIQQSREKRKQNDLEEEDGAVENN